MAPRPWPRSRRSLSALALLLGMAAGSIFSSRVYVRLPENDAASELVVLPSSRPVEEEFKEELPEDSALTEVVNMEELKAALMKLGGERGQPILATFANFSFWEMLKNWVGHVRRVGMGDRMLVAALDVATLKMCRREHIATVRLRTGLGLQNFRGNEKFRDMGIFKLKFLLAVLQLGYDVLLSDTDTVWLANPFQFLDPVWGPMAGADVLVTSDSLSIINDVASMQAEDPEGDLENKWFRDATPKGREDFGNAYQSSFNTGVLLYRATNASLQLVETWLEALQTMGASQNWTGRLFDDQDAFNRLMFEGLFPLKMARLANGERLHNRVLWARQETIRMGILPPGQFCNGHVYFVQRTPQKLGLQVFAVHNTFQFYGFAGKIARFREAHLWLLDPPSYYTEGNFLSCSVDLPESILGIPDEIERHFAANLFYYESLRNAVAIAQILDRVVILPNFVCICDRYWEPTLKPCRFPGSDVDPPIQKCPPDQLFALDKWIDFSYREASFLEHRSVPDDIRNSRVEVQVVARAVDNSTYPARFLPENANDEEVQALLGPLSNVRVLHLTSVATAFCSFENEDDSIQFDAATKAMFEPAWWCCPPGATKEPRQLKGLVEITERACEPQAA